MEIPALVPIVAPFIAKPWYHSKTMWINGLVLVSSWFLNHHGIMAAAGLDADTQVTILAMVNLMVRWVTQQPVKP
jgi:hypothetical protein